VTVVPAAALVPTLLVAVTAKFLGPALAEAVEHVLVALGHPVHAYDVGLPEQDAVSLTLVLTAGDALLEVSVQTGGAAEAVHVTLTAAGRPTPVALLATTA